MFRAYGSFPNGGTETSSLRSPLENIQTWGSSPNAPPPTPTASSTTASSSPDFNSSHTQANVNSQRQNSVRQHLQQSQFQNNLHAHQQQQQQKSQPFYIEAMNNNCPNNVHKNNDIKGKEQYPRNCYQFISFPSSSPFALLLCFAFAFPFCPMR